MKYAKKLIKAFKKSPFDSLSFTLGKVEDTGEAMYINAFIAQPSTLGNRHQPLSLTCHSNATKEERNAFIPLVIEALGRAQSIEELADLLKPSAVDRPALVEPDIQAGAQWSEEDKSRMQWSEEDKSRMQWTAKQQREVPAHESTLKGKLISLLQVGKSDAAAVDAVLNSGLLPDALFLRWLNQLAERAIRRVLGRSGCPEWECWATNWLSGEDRTEAAARAAGLAAAGLAAAGLAAAGLAAARAAARAGAAGLAAARAGAAGLAAGLAAARARAAGLAAGLAAAEAGAASWADERKAQYDDLFSLINEL